jgi:prevent-host-death family protein
MKTLPSTEVKDNFWRIFDMVKSGEPVTITQQGKPTLIILPYEEGMSVYNACRKEREQALKTTLPTGRVFGAMRGKAIVSTEFFDELPEEELRAWEGG